MKSQMSLASSDFASEDNCRNLARIETTIRQFSQEATELDEEIRAEEARVGIFDPKHFTYPCYAKAAAERRDNLLRSVDSLNLQLEKERGIHPYLPTARAPREYDAIEMQAAG